MELEDAEKLKRKAIDRYDFAYRAIVDAMTGKAVPHTTALVAIRWFEDALREKEKWP